MKNKIKELREKKGLSPLQLAVRTGVDSSTIYHWESGWNEPTVINALCLAKELGTTVEEIWYNLPRSAPLKPHKMTKLEARRREMGLTLREITEATGLVPSTLSYYEKEGGFPTIYNAVLLARCLGTTVEELFGP